MASITKKVIRGKTYYYARECKRVDGKPKIVWQKYLGRLEDMVAAAAKEQGTSASLPLATEGLATDLGAVAALYDLVKRLDLVAIVDKHVPKRGSGPSVGEYLGVAAINRCVSPCSKVKIGPWFEKTALRRLLDIDSRQLTSQRFWDNMDRVGQEAIAGVEAELVKKVVDGFDLNLEHLLFDATNFFTFIDTFNDKSTLAKRGKSKQQRASLRIVGLALLVTADFNVPLLHRTYPGNRTDAPTFSALTDDLVRRYRELAKGAEHITLIFDKGNNSKDNLDAVADSPYHFVGSLIPTQHLDLLEISRRRFDPLSGDGLPGVQAFRTAKKIFGIDRTVVVTYNENLFVAQSQTLLREIAKRQSQFKELDAKLKKWQKGECRGRAPTAADVQKKIGVFLKARHMEELFEVDVVEKPGGIRIDYRLNQKAWEDLQETLLGKTILFTDNEQWTDAQIVKAYRAQSHVEESFRTMKDPHHIALRPQYHWTDQKMRVHVFICVLALMLLSLLRRELHTKGIDMSIARILENLDDIREISLIFPPDKQGGKPIIRSSVSRMSPDQKRLYDALSLDRYATS